MDITRDAFLAANVVSQMFCLIWVCLALIHRWQMLLYLIHFYGILVVIMYSYTFASACLLLVNYSIVQFGPVHPLSFF